MTKDILGAQVWQAAIMGCTAVVQIAAARYIGASGLGVTAIIVSNASLCFLLIELNLQAALVRRLAVIQDSGARIDFRERILGARLILAFVLSLSVAVGVIIFHPHYRVTIFFGIVAAVLAQELNPSWWLQGLDRSNESFSLAGISAMIAGIVAIPIVYYFRQPGSENLATSGVALLFYLIYWKRSGALLQLKGKTRAFLRHYALFALENRSFLMGGLAVYLYLYPTQLLLAYTRSLEEAGVYRVAMMPGVAYYGITVAAFGAYYPKIVLARKKSTAEYDNSLRHVGLLIYLIGVLAWIVTLTCSDLFRMAVGQANEISVLLAPALVVSKAIGGVGLVLRAGLLAKSRERLVYQVFFGAGLASVAVNLFVVPRYGFIGAAITEISTETVHFFVLLAFLAIGSKKPNIQA